MSFYQKSIEFQINNFLELYLSKGTIKRMKKEEQYLEYFGAENIKYTRQNSNIYLRCEHNNNEFKIPIPFEFPFRSPTTFYVNNLNYRNILRFNKDTFVSNELKKLNIDCLCCTTKLCNNNWSPVIKFFNFIEEYYNNKKLILKLCNKYWFSKFCNNNNIILEIEELILSFI